MTNHRHHHSQLFYGQPGCECVASAIATDEARPPCAGMASTTAKKATLPPHKVQASGPAQPLDYSFMGLSCLSEMTQHDPVSGKKKAAKPTAASDGGDTPEPAPPSPKSTSSTTAVSLRVNNNAIEHLDDIDQALSAVFEDPTRLQWIDLSGNALSCIKPNTFARYPNLFTLHLHGNQIARYADIDNLAAVLPRLHSLTLHGNPIEEKKYYRNYVIAAIPTLMQLNFSSVTRGDRDKAETWTKIYKKSKHRSNSDEFAN